MENKQNRKRDKKKEAVSSTTVNNKEDKREATASTAVSEKDTTADETKLTKSQMRGAKIREERADKR